MLGKALVGSLGKKKQLLDIQTFAPDTVLEPGKRVTIKETSLTTDLYIMTECVYEFEGREIYSSAIKAMKFVK